MVVLVAEREGEVVGYAYAGMEGNDYMALRGPAGVLYDLVVDPAHRRQGIGTVLMEAALGATAGTGSAAGAAVHRQKNRGAQSDVRARRVSADDDRDDPRVGVLDSRSRKGRGIRAASVIRIAKGGTGTSNSRGSGAIASSKLGPGAFRDWLTGRTPC